MHPSIINIVSLAQLNALIAESPEIILVDFWAPWCGPCRVIAPILEQAAEAIGDPLIIAKVNIDDVPESAQAFGIRSIPTLVYFSAGEEVTRSSGVVNLAAIQRQIEALTVAHA